MLKLIVAYIDSGMFDRVRRDLADYGIVSFSVAAVGGVSSYDFAAPNYGGSAHTQRLPEKIRLECVVGSTHVESVKEIIFRNEGRKSFLYTQDVDSAYPRDSIMDDTSAAAA